MRVAGTGPSDVLPAGPPTVLVVDDERPVRRLFVTALRRSGYRTLEAATGAQALEVLGHEIVDVVLLDRSLPDVSSEDLLRQVRAKPRSERVRVLFVTGDGHLESKLDGLGAGANDYLVKPLSLQELLARVAAQLDDRSRWEGHVEATLTARTRLTSALARVSTDRCLPALESELLEVLADEFALTGLLLIPLEPASGARQTCGTSEEIAPTADVDTVRIPLRAAEGDLGVLEVTVAGGHEAVASALIDLAPQLTSVCAPALRRQRSTRRTHRRVEELVGDHGLRTVYQPIVTLDDRVIVGVEGLSRFADGTPPEAAFRWANAAGVGMALELEAMRALVASAHQLPGAAWLSLNLSAATLLTADIGALTMDADRPIVVEITEHEHIHDYEALRTRAAALVDVRLAVDDAGAGHASLRHVFELQPDLIKLDRGWVAAIEQDPVRQALVQGMVGFAEAMSATIIGEGIEREEEAQMLAELGVPLGQGYLFGRPRPASAV